MKNTTPRAHSVSGSRRSSLTPRAKGPKGRSNTPAGKLSNSPYKRVQKKPKAADDIVTHYHHQPHELIPTTPPASRRRQSVGPRSRTKNGPGSARRRHSVSVGRSRLSTSSQLSDIDQLSVDMDTEELPVGRHLDARRARQVAHEQAVRLENRVRRLNDLKEVYRKRIEHTKKQTEMIAKNREEHERDLARRYALRLKKREKVRKLQLENAKKADAAKQRVQKARETALAKKREQVAKLREERERRRSLRLNEERKILHKKKKIIKTIDRSRQDQRVKNSVGYVKQRKTKMVQSRNNILFETRLRKKLNKRSESMCQREMDVINQLKELEQKQQQAVEDFHQVLVGSPKK